jgi:hypothetical protein
MNEYLMLPVAVRAEVPVLTAKRRARQDRRPRRPSPASARRSRPATPSCIP